MSEPRRQRAALLVLADYIMCVDGDRDHMSKSNLTCADTLSIARTLRRVAAGIQTEGEGK